MADSEVPVERMLRGIGNLAVDKEDLLVDLVGYDSQPDVPRPKAKRLTCAYDHTHELSETDSIRGA